MGGVLGLIGLFVLPGIGLIVGSVVGVVGTELVRSRDSRHALRAGGGWLVGWIVSLLLQGVIAIVMVGIILWRA